MFTANDVGTIVKNGERVKLSLAERQAIADEWNAEKAAMPLKQWQYAINQADHSQMPRWAEDIVDALVLAGLTIPDQTLAKLDAKKTLRKTRP